MELYFLRHGIAGTEASPDTGDAGRALTDVGAEKIQVAARGLRRLGLHLDILLSSPYLRARQTAAIVARELKVEMRLIDALAPGCDVTQLMSTLAEQRGASRIMVVGHEPDFSQMIAALTGGTQVQIKKGGLGRVDMGALDHSVGTLIWLLTPRILRTLGQ